MSTQKAITQHGEIEYETVECDSCSNEVMEGDEITYVLGEVQSSDYWSHKNAYEVEFYEEDFYQGTLCPYCADARNLDIDYGSNGSSSTTVVSNVLSGIRNAHRNYVAEMVEHLNADEMMGPYGEPDIVMGMIMLGAYVCAIIFVALCVAAVIL